MEVEEYQEAVIMGLAHVWRPGERKEDKETTNGDQIITDNHYDHKIIR